MSTWSSKYVVIGTTALVITKIIYNIIGQLYNDRLERQQNKKLKRIAQAILNADFCLLSTGAGIILTISAVININISY